MLGFLAAVWLERAGDRMGRVRLGRRVGGMGKASLEGLIFPVMMLSWVAIGWNLFNTSVPFIRMSDS